MGMLQCNPLRTSVCPNPGVYADLAVEGSIEIMLFYSISRRQINYLAIGKDRLRSVEMLLMFKPQL
jgi:hypothetical protein